MTKEMWPVRVRVRRRMHANMTADKDVADKDVAGEVRAGASVGCRSA